MTHICVSKLSILGSDNGLSPGRRKAIVWTSAGILLIGPIGTNFSEILIGIQTFSFTKMHLKISSAKCRPFFLGLNVLISRLQTHSYSGCYSNGGQFLSSHEALKWSPVYIRMWIFQMSSCVYVILWLVSEWNQCILSHVTCESWYTKLKYNSRNLQHISIGLDSWKAVRKQIKTNDKTKNLSAAISSAQDKCCL